MADGDEVVERVRRSVAVAAAEGTARIRFTPHRVVGRSFESVLAERSSARAVSAFGVAKRAMKRGLSVIPVSSSESGLAAGQIDFGQRRCVYNAGTSWKLFAPGRHFTGRPGEWEADEHDGIVFEEPFWLLELIRAAVDAVDEGPDSLRRAACRRYSSNADFGRATASADRAMALPVWSDELDLTRLAVDVWLDDGGRIRQASLQGSGSLTTLELFDFGEPLPIELPQASEIISEGS